MFARANSQRRVRTTTDWPRISVVLAVGIGLELLAQTFAGTVALPIVDINRLIWALSVAVGVLLSLVTLALIESMVKARHFTGQHGQLDLSALLRSVTVSPYGDLLVLFMAAYFITGSASLAEYYRVHTATWHDGVLWQLEKPIFQHFFGSALDAPRLWDAIYFLLWPALFAALAVLVRLRRRQQILVFALAALLSFYATRILAIWWPTAGPAFHQPHLFELEQTLSREVQQILRDYMAGRVVQNGLFPGTMAMPSLHVGLTGMAAWFLFCEARWTAWITVPWTALIWLSTVALGWHYAVDGVGGLIVAAAAVATAARISGDREARSSDAITAPATARMPHSST